MTRPSQTQQDVGTLVEALNRKINGWANYFCLGPVSSLFAALSRFFCLSVGLALGSITLWARPVQTSLS
jgi:hypothetical protein